MVTIRFARPDDVPGIVAVHQAGFQGFFLTFLGPMFLHEFYSAILADSDGIGFVAEVEYHVGGFVMGAAQPEGFYRRLLRQRWWRFARASMLPALRQPTIIPRLLRALSMPEQATQHVGRGTLMSIAVAPDAQKNGVGQALVRAFLDEAARRGLRQVDLTTDQDSNDATNRFYQNLGFICERTFTTPEGRAMNEYVINLAGS